MSQCLLSFISSHWDRSEGFQSTSASRKATRDASSALKRSTIQYLCSPMPLNFSDETDTHAMPQFMKVWRHKKMKQKMIS